MSIDRKLRVLHVTPWYPHAANPVQGIWIRRHIDSIKEFVSQQVIHIQVHRGQRLAWSCNKDGGYECITVSMPFKSWVVVELTWAAILFFRLVLHRDSRRFDVVNFHIAYPSLSFWHWIKIFFRVPAVITEHWSAYHFNFGLPATSSLPRIKRIFRMGIPVICVSHSLAEDIKRFSNCSAFPVRVVPNVVPSDMFFHDVSVTSGKKDFLMICSWKWPKRPELLLMAFHLWNTRRGDRYTLRVGGYSEHDASVVESFIREHDLAKDVVLLGPLSPEEVAREMRHAVALLHATEYETFSVVCAEALCCGTPVIASAVGGLIEVVKDHSGILVKNNTVEEWSEAFDRFLLSVFDSDRISTYATERFAMRNVGRQYWSFLIEMYEDHG